MQEFEKLYRSYILWDDNNIKGFFGKEHEYRWLSNFYRCDVWYEGLLYGSSEAAYMAGKVISADIRKDFAKGGIYDKPSEARKAGQSLELRSNWDSIKYDIMLSIIFNKFSNNFDIKKKLLNTNNKYLEETNHWHDNFWGNCICEKCKYKEGLNNLGKILMKVRECLRK